MSKVILMCLLLVILMSFERRAADRVFLGFFIKGMAIDTTTRTCGAQTYALLYAFESDSSRAAANKQFLYGLVKCPEIFNQELFNYGNRLRISYREATKKDLRDVLVLNRQKFFNVRYYLVTGIELAE